MKATLTIYRGHETLFTAEITSKPKAYEHQFDKEKQFAEDLFNIERYINEQGAYRAHVETKS